MAYAQGNFAIQFDGFSGTATADLSVGSSVAAVTFETWFSPGAVSGVTCFITDIRTMTNFPDPHKCLKLFLSNGTIGLYCNQNAVADDLENLIDELSEVTVTPGLWYHVAVVADGVSMKVYVNGALSLDVNRPVAYQFDGNETMYLAADYWNGGLANITVDELRVWSVARSQAEIQADMNREIDPLTEGLLAYYKCNEGEGWTMTDAVSGLHDGFASGGFDWVAGGAPLPITLNSFSATPVGESVALRWTTLSEVNNYGFEVQRSLQGGAYSTLPGAFVPGHGTTNEPQSYRYTDTTAGSGVWLYRLKQIDLDGSIHFSDGVRVSILATVTPVGLPVPFSLEQNYPNPWNPSTTIRYSIPERALVSLEVFTVLGRRVATLVREEKPAGYYNVVFRGEGLASGVYYYALRVAGARSVKKFLLVK
jgi:hypothetical protein